MQLTQFHKNVTTTMQQAHLKLKKAPFLKHTENPPYIELDKIQVSNDSMTSSKLAQSFRYVLTRMYVNSFLLYIRA